MRTKFIQTIQMVLLTFGLFLLQGCGSSSSSSYKIAYDPAWYSIEVTGKEKNVIGFVTDLIAEISSATKTPLTLMSVNWDTLFQGLQNEKYQGVLSGLTPYTFNQQIYGFSDLFLATGPVLVVPTPSTATSFADLSGKEVAAISNSTSIVILQKYPGLLIRTYDSIPKMFNDLSTGVVDAAVAAALPSESYCKDLYQGQLKIISAPLNDDGLRLVTLQGQDKALMEVFNKGLSILKENKTYDKLLKKWSLSGPSS